MNHSLLTSLIFFDDVSSFYKRNLKIFKPNSWGTKHETIIQLHVCDEIQVCK